MTTGILQREADRQDRWADRGLPDPVSVLTIERLTRLKTGESFISPLRPVLDAHFANHPNDRPNQW